MISIAAAFFFMWLVVISWMIFRIRSHYNRLTTHTRKEKLDEMLDRIIESESTLRHEVERIKKQITEFERQAKFHYHKTGIVRFNPFERGGGEQSFVLAFLDSQNNGITMNCIYTREGLRIYIKRVQGGKGQEYELSEEEKKAIAESI